MPTADATLLPPPFASSSVDDEPQSARSLDAVGVGAVLGAMIEHRRASEPSSSGMVVASEPEPETLRTLPNDSLDDRVPRPGLAACSAATPHAFLKAR